MRGLQVMLLSRCLLHKTQNANESLHHSIWSKCTKRQYHQAKKVQFAVIAAIAEFNYGPSFNAELNICYGFGIGHGKFSEKLRHQKEQKRLDKSIRNPDGVAFSPTPLLQERPLRMWNFVRCTIRKKSQLLAYLIAVDHVGITTVDVPSLWYYWS